MGMAENELRMAENELRMAKEKVRCLGERMVRLLDTDPAAGAELLPLLCGATDRVDSILRRMRA